MSFFSSFAIIFVPCFVVLDLSGNNITNLDWFAQSVFPELQVFNIPDNQIAVLPDHAFITSPEIYLVDLSNNLLTNITSRQMDNMTSVK